MKNSDIRWHQRFSNFQKAFASLQEFIEAGELNALEEQGLIKAFEYTFELAWNTIKDFYHDQGETGIQGSKDAFRLAFNRGLIDDGDVWMQMVADRNNTSHSYNKKIAAEISGNIVDNYFDKFFQLNEALQKLLDDESKSE